MVEYTPGRLDAVFHALADPTRRALLRRLARGTASVTALAEPFPISLNAVSKHLQVLERAGLLRRRVEGRVHLCSVNPAPLAGAAAWIGTYRRFWEDRLDALERFLTPEHGHDR